MSHAARSCSLFRASCRRAPLTDVRCCFVARARAASCAFAPRRCRAGARPQATLAKSRFEYVRAFETADALLPHCWLVVRIDGKGFTKFSDAHGFEKPNDERALGLMNAAAKAVMEELSDITLAYGQSDEFSFVLRKHTGLYERRASKLISVIVSLFTSNYVMRWPALFGSTPLRSAPAFDGRVVLYPSDASLRDYLSWRQADCHINCQYNTVFWALVQRGGLSRSDAQARLAGTKTADKNELLFSEFGINYAQLPPLHRRGSVLRRARVADPQQPATVEGGAEPTHPPRLRSCVVVEHEDMIGDVFWAAHPELLAD